MAQPFLRIDLANQARDFQNTVIEAGWPMIDKANANYQILRKWLGASVAEPERTGDEVVFYLRNETGARIDHPNVIRATDKDLIGPLKSEFHSLLKSLQSAEPKNTSEKNLHAKAVHELQSLTTEQRAGDRRCCLFKYRDDNKKWHLVWAPGYRRKDDHPANPLICTNPACSLLFLQRADGGSKCPRCQKTPSVRPAEGEGVKQSRVPLMLVLLLLVAVLGGAGWWYFNRDTGDPAGPAEARLAVSPASATITQDGQLEYTITFTDAEGNEKDVTRDVSVVVRSKEEKGYEKTPVKYDIFHNRAEAKGVGSAELEFFYLDDDENKHTAVATLTVEPRRNPKRVLIEPASVKLGVGTTAQLKMMGEYEDGRKEDLTDKAEWNWDDPGQSGCVFAYKGAIQGMNVGKTQLKARYRATPESEYVIAEASIEVQDVNYKILHLALASDKVVIGQDPGLIVEVESETGEKMSVLGSALLKLEVAPQELADVQKQPPYLYPNQPGQGTLTATFRGITKEIPFEVESGTASGTLALEVNPRNLKLAVGEIADLAVSGNGEPRFTSSDQSVVEITPQNRLIGKKPGSATVTVKRGEESAEVKVEVAAVAFAGLAFDPEEVTVRVDDVVALRLIAQVDEDTQVELDPLYPLLEWVRFPAGEYVEINRSALDVRGLSPTGDDQKTLTVRLAEHEATARIRVVPGPLTLALEPAEPIELPVGQKQPLTVVATYGNGERQEIPAGRVEWISNSADGLTLQNGKVTADAPAAGPLTVSVKYQGQTSNEVQIRSTHSAPVRLSLAANPSQVAVGETGQLVLSATTPGGQNVGLDMAGSAFESGDEAIVAVDPVTGGFRAEREGRVMVTATHPTSREPVTAEITVTPAMSEMPPAKPEGVRIITEASEPIILPVGVVFVDWKVEAIIDGEPRDVTADSLITIEGDPESAPISITSESIVGVLPGEAKVKAEFAGQPAENTLTFQVVEELELDQIVVGPPSVNLAVGENTRLDAVGFLDGRKVGLVTGHPEVTWKSSNPDIVQAEGPVIAALSAGTADVTAHFQDIASGPAQIRVVGEGSDLADVLRLDPTVISLRPGESVNIGGDVKVLRGDADLSRDAVVAPANTDVVYYDESNRMLTANLPGRTRVTIAVGEQTANLDVTVLTDAPSAAGGSVSIEPAGGVIAVGELLSLQVYLHSKDGNRYNVTNSALFGTSDPKLATMAGTSVQGIAPGRVTITAQVPGADSPATATFDVRNLEFTHLEVQPSRFDLTVGQRLWYEIHAVGPAGRRRLGNDPELKITHHHLDGRVEDLGFPHIIEGKWPTNGQAETVKVRWKDLERDVAYTVRDDRITGLVIRPDDLSIEVGDSLDYQVFVRRGGRLDPLTNHDGVELSGANPVIASQTSALRVRGESPGTTEVLAQYAGQQARARLRVIPRTRPAAPAGRPIALRIRPDTFQLELGINGAPIRVVRLNSDGTSDDVAHLAEFTATPEGIVEIESTASGPVITPKKIGQTQIHAKVGDLQTELPMLVDVTDKLPGRPRLIIDPNIVRVVVGGRQTLGRVSVLPSQGGPPIPVPYKISATPNDFFTVENEHTIRGTAAGQALANVTVDDPKSKYHGEPGTVIVVVADPGSHQTQTEQTELELTGPTETTEGAEAAFQVHLINGSAVSDVTNDATLVLAKDDDKIAELQPGCRLIAKSPGVVTVQARYEGEVSNTIRLRIGPVARNFSRLELEINTEPIGVGETRGYKIWGDPAGGGPRQDLTRLVTTDPKHATRPHVRFNVLKPSPDANVAAHNSPNIVGRNPGTVSLQAAIGNKLASDREEVTVIGEIRNALDLRLEPGSITSKVGETTPPFKVLVQTPGATRYREVDPASPELRIYSENTGIAAPIDDAKGRFTAKRPGATQIKVEFGGLTAFANVTVISNRFKRVNLGKVDVGFDTFKTSVIVTTDPIEEKLEYRVYEYGKPVPAGGWKPAARQSDGTQTVSLETEELRLLGSSQFRLMLESRVAGDQSGKSIDRYPYMFNLEGK